jgi:putative DNA primase/helicase
MRDLRHAARLLGGEVSGQQVLAPGPGHSSHDRSMAVRFTADDFVVHSFCGDDPILCRDYVRERLGLPAWQPGDDGRNRSAPFHRIREWDQQQHDGAEKPMTPEELERAAYAVRIWDEGQDPRGTLAERYLREHRKLDLPAEIASSVLRFHPQCPWRDENVGPTRVPALIAVFRSIDDDVVTAIQRIALNPDGAKIGRRMLGIVRRSAIKLAVPRIGELVIAEGVETDKAPIDAKDIDTIVNYLVALQPAR